MAKFRVKVEHAIEVALIQDGGDVNIDVSCGISKNTIAYLAPDGKLHLYKISDFEGISTCGGYIEVVRD